MTRPDSPRLGSHRRRFGRPIAPLALAVLVAGEPHATPALAGSPTDAAPIARDFAGSAVEDGTVIGAEVAILAPGRDPQFFGYGYADVDRWVTTNPNTVFEVGSVTKVFTTNLLGQAAAHNPGLLNQTLANYQTQLGSLPAPGPDITLWELGSFTAGYPTFPPPCPTGQSPSQTGCLPSNRPTIRQYNAADFLTFFRTTPPSNQTKYPVTTPPFPYFYSDFSTGLVGLLLGADPKAPLSNAALKGWNDLLDAELLAPLRMEETALHPSQSDRSHVAAGYQQALASATIGTGGAITGFTVISRGQEYQAAPQVSIAGGGGQDARAIATISAKGLVVSICPADASRGGCTASTGRGYIAPPRVMFSGGNPMNAATGTAIVRDGQVVGVRIDQQGGGYQSAPVVTITSGQRAGGDPVKATAYIRHGAVVYVGIESGGSGFVDPLSVLVEPGGKATNPVPIWAPAGALKSDARDMASFAAAALGRTRVEGHPIPSQIIDGFRIAETAYACKGADPSLTGCMHAKSALGWDLLSANKNGPEYLTKDGGLPGFSSYIGLLPAQDIAVVVLVNSRQDDPETTRPAVAIGEDILWALYCRSSASACVSN